MAFQPFIIIKYLFPLLFGISRLLFFKFIFLLKIRITMFGFVFYFENNVVVIMFLKILKVIFKNNF